MDYEPPPPMCGVCYRKLNDDPWVVYDGGLVIHEGGCEVSAKARGKQATVWRSSVLARRTSSREVRLQRLNRGFQTPAKRRAVTSAEIVEATATFFRLDPEQLRGPRRSQNVSYARHIAMYLCRELTDLSLPLLGAVFGGRDHTTVLYAINKIEEQAGRNPVRDHLALIRRVVHNDIHRA